MTDLQAHLNTLTHPRHLQSIQRTLAHAEVKITLWGHRVVTEGHFTGSVYLDDISRKTREIGLQFEQQKTARSIDDPMREQSAHGLKIITQLTHFYSLSDIQIEKSHFFTKLMNWIREFFFPLSYREPRLMLQESTQKHFTLPPPGPSVFSQLTDPRLLGIVRCVAPVAAAVGSAAFQAATGYFGV